MAQDAEQISALKGRRVSLGGHFEGVVTIEDARPLRSGEGAEIKVRLASGELDERSFLQRIWLRFWSPITGR